MAAYGRDHFRNDIDKNTVIAHFRLVAQMAANVSDLGLDKPLEGGHQVLIITADDDEMFSHEAQDALVASYPVSCAIRFPSGGHTMVARREELWGAISDFIRG